MNKVLTLLLLTISFMTQAENPFLTEYKTPFGAIPFDKIKISDYEPAIREGMAQHLREIDAITRQRSVPTFENTIEALENSGKLLDNVLYPFFALTSADTNDELMAVEQTISPLLSEHSTKISLNEALFQRVKYVYDNRAKLNLNAEQTKLLEDKYDGMLRSGASLEGEARTKYKELTSELAQLQLSYSKNILKELNSITFYFNKEDLKGLPEREIAAAAQRAKEKGNEGKYLITLQGPVYMSFMEYADRRDLREMIYKAFTSRNQSGEYNNIEILKRISEVRLEIAKLFGKKNFAEYQLEHTMAQTPENVYKLLNQLLEAYLPVAKDEVKEVAEFASKREGKTVDLKAWDWSYYSNKLKTAKFDLNDEMLRPYFELNNVIKGVFGLATKLYGLEFKKLNNVPVYHKDVTVYKVTDATGKYVGLIYADFHPRESKQGGAWMTSFKEQTKTKDGKDERPQVTIVMNFTTPTKNNPSLLSYYEVETFLHEFGHSLHGLLTDVTYKSQSGTNVYRDFVELPSQFNENFLSQKEFLDGFAKHYKTGEVIPDSLITKIVKSSQYHAAYTCVRQLSFGLLDMAWHSIETPVKDAVAFEKAAIAPTQVLPTVPGSMLSTTFSHIFSGGYAAGYYGYKWAEVLDADAFSVFLKNGIYDPATAKSFKENILMRGGTASPMELYKKFRGCEPTIDALMIRDGIKN